nr:uncharacterized protein LOC106731618 [Pelodiscus sinensis]|eukprot:XP_014426418.1 uncharacterized protein LOC106731618 [Pelodiscus sinensis]
MAGYCRQWIPNFSQLAKPLQELTRNATPSPIPWGSQQDTAFSSLKQTLASAPALGLPDYSRHFTLFCHKKEGCALGVLVQKHSNKYRPLAYYSTYLDPVAASFPPCLRAIAAAARILEQAEPLVLQSPLTLAVPHSVSALLLKGKTQHLSNARLVKYERLLFASPNVSVICCNSLNPATLLPAPHEGKPHNCLQVVQAVTSPKPNLFKMPLNNPDFILYTDSSCFYNSSGVLVAGYAVCTVRDVIKSAPLPAVSSAQVAELIALTRACHITAGASATIYTDSWYAFGVVHNFSTLWKQRGFLTSSGHSIKNEPYVAALLNAVLLSSALAIVKCVAHSSSSNEVALKNDIADRAAKATALCPPRAEALYPSFPPPSAPLPSLSELALLQDQAPESEKQK